MREGEILSDSPIFVKREYFESIPRSHIKTGYFLFSIMASIGNIAVVPDNFTECTANRAVGILIPRDVERLDANYLLALFGSNFGINLLEKLTRGGIQKRTNLGDIEKLKIPLPPLEIQRSLVAEIEAARQTRKQKLAQADELLSSFDAYLLSQLGLSAPEESDRQVFAVRLSEIEKRFDSPFYHPSFRSVVQTIKETTNVSLGRLVQFSSEVWDVLGFEEEVFTYIEISSINLSTGEVNPTKTPVNEAPSRARMVVRNGDIIVSTTRPHHGAIAMIDDELNQCIASTGFAVIRKIIDRRITRIYLWCILRSQLCLRQMRQRSSGGNYPAITAEELKQVLIPIPSIEIQEEIATEVQKRRSNAQRLRQEAKIEWEAAKTRFEHKLLGEET